MSNNIFNKHREQLCELLFPDFVSHHRKVEQIASSRLLFLRHLVGLSYTYSHKQNLFYQAFSDAVGLDEWEKHSVIDFEIPDEFLIQYLMEFQETKGRRNIDQQIAAKSIRSILKKQEYMMLCMMAHGFNHKELKVICRMGHPNSIPVKLYRMRRRYFEKEEVY